MKNKFINQNSLPKKNVHIIMSLTLVCMLLYGCGFKEIDGETLIPVQGIWSGTDSLNRHVTFLFNKDSVVSVEIKQNATATSFLYRYVGTYKVVRFSSGLAGQTDYNTITGNIQVNRTTKSFSFISYAVFAKSMLNAGENYAEMSGHYNTTTKIPVTLKNIYPYYFIK